MSDSNQASPPVMNAECVLRIKALSKRYGQHQALHPFSLDLYAGEVHVLFGENGAGKSTLISMLAGARDPSSGQVEINGWQGQFESVAHARSHGIRAVFQEFSLIPTLTVAQNIVLGEEPVVGVGMLSPATMNVEVNELIQRLGFDLNPHDLVSSLPRGKQQMVEICKALRRSTKVLILDEPTASLSEHDAQSLFTLVKALKQQGTAIIYITHRMHEIPLLGDRVTVLRDGRQIATVSASAPESQLIELMTGRTMSDIYPPLNTEMGHVRLFIRDLSLAPEPGSVTVQNISLNVRAGEIVGVAGLVGCGKSELGQACFGLRKIQTGEILVDGQLVHFKHPDEAIKRGIWYSPSDRKTQGLALEHSAGKNMSLSGLSWGQWSGRLLKVNQEKRALTELSSRVEFNAQRLGESLGNFSGGNQQKVLLAKGLAQPISVYVFDEPTVGVDVGARQSIYKCLAELSAAGAAIVLISSDLPELMGVTHRMVVMKEGRIVAEFDRENYDEHRILEKFF